MSSIFGTFRRPKKKPTGEMVDSSPLTPSSRTSTVFSSTPNLLKVDQSRGGGGAISPKNKISQIPPGLSGGFESRRPSNYTVGVGVGVGGEQSQISMGKKSGSSSSMRSFMSMMNVMGSLKRSKSIKKLGWGSTLNVSPNSKESSPAPSTQSFSSSGKSKPPPKSKSDEFLDAPDDDLYDTKSLRRRKRVSSTSSSSSRRKSSSIRNTEPGVNSSESSSENSSIQDTNSIRTSSERSEGLEDSDNEPDIMEKDPVDLERKKNILLGTKKFNMDPKKGIEFLVEKGILQFTPHDVARFLKDGYGLSKGSIGNYLGERVDFNEDVLKAFVELHDFKNLILVHALRQFLWAFRLPGESQKISRMLDAFAERYHQNNPELISTDTCSVLCYSIIMLNTELHNPNVKEKVSLDQFIKRNRGIEGGELFTHQFMVSLYNSILDEPFRFPEEDGNDLMLTFFNPDYEGWLYKFGGRPRSWKRLWFILSNNCLYYFKFTTDKTPLGIIPLENILVRVPPEKPGSKLNVMILYKESPDPRIVDHIKTCKTLPGGQTVPKLYSSIQLGTPDRKERERWVRSINANHSMSRFYSDLTLKKAKIQHDNKNKSSTSVRKSQISLPTTTITSPDDGSIPLPPEVLLDPSKDPNNFFIAKNLSSISLVGDNTHGSKVDVDIEGGETSSRVRSRSESRLYQGRKVSLEVSTATSTIVRSRFNSPVLRHKHRHHYPSPHSESNLLNLNPTEQDVASEATATSPSSIRRSPSPRSIKRKTSQIQLRTETVNAIFDRYKKLSMINELTVRSGSVSSDIEDKSTISKHDLESEISISDSISTGVRSSSSSTGSDDTEFEYSVLRDENRSCDHNAGGGASFCGSTNNLLESKSAESLDLLDNYSILKSKPHQEVELQLNMDLNQCMDSNGNVDKDINQIQIIDCCNPTIRTKTFTSSGDEEPKTDDENCSPNLNQTITSHPHQPPRSSDNEHLNIANGNIPEMCFESIYESNV